MTRRVLATSCNPAVLGWARIDAGYSIEAAADKTHFEVERLTRWEQGDEQPTIGQLRTLASVYRRPLAIFFMPEPPLRGFQPLRDFRRLPDAEDLGWSPPLRALVRRARAQQRTYAELLRDLGEELPELPTPPQDDDPEVTGGFARDILAVRLNDQQAWRDAGEALRGWTRAIEELGVLVLHTSTTRGHTVSTDEMLGFSDPLPIPMVLLNGSDHARRRTFTLLHEFAHLLLRQAGVCDLHDRYTTPDFDPMEVRCNAIAAATLMPRDAFLQDPEIAARYGREWDDLVLGQIARRFTTSREAVLRRLLTLGLTSEDFYRDWRERYYRELEQQEEREAGGFADYYLMKVRELGLPYSSTVLEAYNRDAINASDLARFLSIKLKNLPRFEEEVTKALSRGT